MTKKTEPSVQIDVGVGAKASLEIKTEVPSSSSGRLLDALTDLLRPISERRGLRADQIRLQREDVLIEITKKARERAEIENAPVHPLPNKFLVPFLEKASLEEPGSELADRWADLLASAVLDPEAAHPRFISVLSELRREQVRFLQKISRNGLDQERLQTQPYDLHECKYRFDSQTLEKDFWSKDLPGGPEEITDFFERELLHPGVALMDVIIWGESEPGDDLPPMWSMVMNDESLITHDDDFSIGVLTSLNVISSNRLYLDVPGLSISVYYYVLTGLGTELVTACDRELVQLLASQPGNAH